MNHGWDARRLARASVVVGALSLASLAAVAAGGAGGAIGAADEESRTVDRPGNVYEPPPDQEARIFEELSTAEKPGTVHYQPPPDPWIEGGLIPGGFETMGPWTAHRRTPLYRAPGSRKIVATVDACEEITVDESQLRGRPQELRVLKAHPPFQKGERMWILAHDLEEGYEELWYRGAIRDDVEVFIEETWTSDGGCTRPTPKCWLWHAKEQPQVLWILMRRKEGTRGWSKRAEKDFTDGPAKAHSCP